MEEEMTQRKKVGRLAMRVEGDLWVAYFAPPETMDGALFLGSIQMALVQDQDAKQVFMALMRDAVGKILQDATGVLPHWPEPFGTPAPEHERGGSA